MKKASLLILSFLSLISVNAEVEMSRQEYIETWSNEAVFHMNQYGIPASITLAQGILESGNGNSYLASYANNHFGIKCHGWEGEKAYKDDDKKNECFRKYLSPSESYLDHSKFLVNGSRYDFLFDYKSNDYKNWAKGLKKAGYATNPKYPELLIALIEKNKLYTYDNDVFVKNQEVVIPSVTEEESKASSVHKVSVSSNRIKYVIVKKGDTYFSIAKEFEMGLWQLYKYNDISNKDILREGDVMYLQPKRNKAKQDVHIAGYKETLKDVSQKYGVKLKKLAKRNCLDEESALQSGQKIILR